MIEDSSLDIDRIFRQVPKFGEGVVPATGLLSDRLQKAAVQRRVIKFNRPVPDLERALRVSDISAGEIGVDLQRIDTRNASGHRRLIRPVLKAGPLEPHRLRIAVRIDDPSHHVGVVHPFEAGVRDVCEQTNGFSRHITVIFSSGLNRIPARN